MNKKIVSGLVLVFGVLVVGLMSPNLGQAQTSDAVMAVLQAQVQSLLKQVGELQAKLQALTGSAPSSGSAPGWTPGGTTVSTDSYTCPLPPEGIKIGYVGDDVKVLQQYLAKDTTIYPEGLVTGYFGPLTARALTKFQIKQDLPATGVLSLETRERIQVVVQPEVVRDTSATSIQVPPTFAGGGPAYPYPCPVPPKPIPPPPPTDSIKVYSPESGAVWAPGTTKTINWAYSTGVKPIDGSPQVLSQRVVKITLSPYYACLYDSVVVCALALPPPYVIAEWASDTGAYEWNIPADVPFKGKVQVVVSNGVISGTSAVFEISSLTTPTTQKVTVYSPALGETWYLGKAHDIKWNSPFLLSSQLKTVTISLGPSYVNPVCTSQPCPAVVGIMSPVITLYKIASGVPDTGSYTWTIPTDLPNAYRTNAKVTVSVDGANLSGESQVFSIVAPPAGLQSALPIEQQQSTFPVSSGSLLPSASYQILSLRQGWNFISFNRLPESKDVRYIFKDWLQNIDVVKTMEAGQELSYTPASGVGALTKVEFDNSYKVHANKAFTMYTYGNPPPSGLSTRLNYVSSNYFNYLGYPLTTETDIETFFNSIKDKVVTVKAGDGSFWVPGVINGIGKLKPGQGYEVAVKEDVNFTYPLGGVANLPPVIESITGLTTVKVADIVTWTVKAYDPEGSALTYRVDWGDGNVSTQPNSRIDSKTVTFYNVYATTGVYSVSVTVTDDKGLTARKTISIYVGPKDRAYQTLQFKQGWNFISFNRLPETARGLRDVFKDQLVNADVITTWENDQELKYDPRNNIETLTRLEYDNGYKVYANKDFTLYVSGVAPTQAEATTRLYYVRANYFNYMGYPNDQEMSAELFFNSIKDKINTVKAQDGSFWVPGVINTLGNLKPGQGYQVAVKEDVSLVMPVFWR